VLVADVTFHDDDPAPRFAWLRSHLEALAEVPLPGNGRTGDRLRTLAAIAKFLNDRTVRERLGTARDAQEILAIFENTPPKS